MHNGHYRPLRFTRLIMASKDTKYARLLLTSGISSITVAKGTGFKRGYISMVKNGYQNLTVSNLKKLCLYHDCTPNDILDHEKWFAEAAARRLAKQAKENQTKG